MSHFPKTIGQSVIQVKNSSGNIIAEYSGNPIAAELSSKFLDFGARHAQKYVDVIVAEVTDAKRLELVRCEVEHKDALSDEATTLPVFTLEELARALFMRVTDRYVKIRIRSDSVGVFWRLGALEVYGTADGQRF